MHVCWIPQLMACPTTDHWSERLRWPRELQRVCHALRGTKLVRCGCEIVGASASACVTCFVNATLAGYDHRYHAVEPVVYETLHALAVLVDLRMVQVCSPCPWVLRCPSPSAH